MDIIFVWVMTQLETSQNFKYCIILIWYLMYVRIQLSNILVKDLINSVFGLYKHVMPMTVFAMKSSCRHFAVISAEHRVRQPECCWWRQ